MTVNRKKGPRKTKAKREAEKRREYIYSVAFDVVRQIGDVVGGGLAETDYKLRDITGALKDLEDILDVVSEEDGEEKAFRLEKLRREVTKTEGENELTVTLEGVDEEWGE
ncbi:MAG: hypothetical protein IKH09_08640 [Clostridia bacterium]|nr:hypothetical protein [Clostridia bacterium]